MKVDKIVIVGGGSSGWISAAFLAKTFSEKEITVIESPNIPIVGVGESTLADITNLRDYLGIDEKQFMKATNASYKMSIKFTDFYEKDSGGFHYPFRCPDLSESQNGLYDWLELKAFYKDNIDVADFVRCYFPHAALFEQNKISENRYGEFGSYCKQTDVAYHFDSVLFGKYLKENHCLPNGVKHISAEVIDAKISENGIETLFLDNGAEIQSDLFIDCTGFKSLLLSHYLNEPFDSYEDDLPNNRAWAVQLPYKNKESELEPFTNCTAIDNGWVWNIPLWSRLGTGYVYSDKFVDSTTALEEFKTYLKSDKMVVPRSEEEIEQLQFKDIPMRVGIHKRTFVKNVCAIGLSAGFIEPLESNGLFTVQAFLLKLAKSMLRGKVSKWDKDVYNAATRGMYNNFVEFVGAHYSLSHRDDTQYWQAIQNKTFSQQLVDMQPTSIVGYWHLHNQKMFGAPIEPLVGITYISVGMNYFLYDSIDQDYGKFGANIENRIKQIESIYDRKKEKWLQAAKHEPTLYEYLSRNIYNPNEYITFSDSGT